MLNLSFPSGKRLTGFSWRWQIPLLLALNYETSSSIMARAVSKAIFLWCSHRRFCSLYSGLSAEEFGYCAEFLRTGNFSSGCKKVLGARSVVSWFYASRGGVSITSSAVGSSIVLLNALILFVFKNDYEPKELRPKRGGAERGGGMPAIIFAKVKAFKESLTSSFGYFWLVFRDSRGWRF